MERHEENGWRSLDESLSLLFLFSPSLFYPDDVSSLLSSSPSMLHFFLDDKRDGEKRRSFLFFSSVYIIIPVTIFFARWRSPIDIVLFSFG